MTQIILPSGQVLSARTAASTKRAFDDRIKLQETKQLCTLLGRLPDSVAAEFRQLCKGNTSKGKANPRKWSNATVHMYARSLLDSTTACRQANVDVRSIHDLTGLRAVAAIRERYTTVSGSGQTASCILRGIRPLVRLSGHPIPAHMQHEIRVLLRTPRRDGNEALPTTAECLNASLTEFERAVKLIHDGRPRRGKTLLRDAIIMAVQTLTNFRRGEFSSITLDSVFFDAAKGDVRIIIRESASKVRQVQLGLIKDERVAAMLRKLIDQSTTRHLFLTNWDSALNSVSIYKALKRTSLRTVRVALNFNKIRRIAVSDETNIDAMRRRARHSRHSEVAEQTYSRHSDDIGIDECRIKIKQFGLLLK